MKKSLLLILTLFLGVYLYATATSVSNSDNTIELVSIDPTEGSEYTTAYREGNVGFLFRGISSELEADSVLIILPNGERIEVLQYTSSYAYYVTFDCFIGGQMNQFYEEGKIKPGDEFKVRLQGLKSTEGGATYGSDGICEVTYKMGAKPTELVSTSVANGDQIPAFSRPNPDSDEGKVVFEFTDPVNVGSANYGAGGREDATYKEIPLPFTIDGCKVIVNLQGIALDPESLGLDAEHTHGNITLKQVTRASDGTNIKGDKGSEGSVSLYVTLGQSISESIYGGIEHAGVDIDKAEQLVIFATEEFYFDDVSFEYTCGTSPAKISFTGENLSGTAVDGGYEYHVPLGDFNFSAGDVKVSVTDPRSAYNQKFVIQEWTFTSAGRSAANGPKVFIASPKENEIISTMPSINLTFNEPISIESALLINTDEGKTYSLDTIKTARISVNGLEALVNPGFEDYGHMTLSLRAKNTAGTYVTYGTVEGYVSLNFHVKQNALHLVSSSPSSNENATELKEIRLLFESPLTDDVIGGFAADAKARLLTLQGEEVTSGALSSDENDYMGVVVTLADTVKAAGTYVLLIEEKQIFNNGFNSEDENYGVGLEGWEALYNVKTSLRLTIEDTSGIENLATSGKKPESIYDLTGRRISGNAKSGIYIQNGKKVLVK